MKIKRKLSVSRGPADRDPMFGAVWYSNLEPLQVITPRQVDAPSQASATVINLPPMAPEADTNWLAVIGLANEVTATLRKDADFNGDVLVGVVRELVDADPSADTIIATYRARMKGADNG